MAPASDAAFKRLSLSLIATLVEAKAFASLGGALAFPDKLPMVTRIYTGTAALILNQVQTAINMTPRCLHLNVRVVVQ